MLNLGDTVELKIEKIVYEGKGLARKNGLVFFVDDVCDEDLIEAKIIKRKKNYLEAKLINIIEPSKYRTKPFCPIYNACGGCQWQHITYEHQLEIKQNIVKETLEKALNRKIETEKIFPSKETKEFRYKVQMPVSQTKNSKRYLIGYYKKGSHNITNIKFCPIQPDIINKITEKIRTSAQVSAYNEKNYKGELRHIIYRISKYSNDILVCFVVNNTVVSKPVKDLAKTVYSEFEQIKGVSVNFNTQKNNVILGKETICINGDEVYREKIGNIEYVISPDSFFQVNPDSFKNILDEVKLKIEQNFPAGKPEILDAYSGVGSFALYLSDIASKITCVEEVENACKNTQKACEINGIKNIKVFNGDAQKIFEGFVKNNKKFDAVILDPPRKGCSKEAVDYCLKLAKKMIVYVSCNPNSLARDLKYFEDNGWKLSYVRPVDMFCHTYHVETIAVIEKK